VVDLRIPGKPRLMADTQAVHAQEQESSGLKRAVTPAMLEAIDRVVADQNVTVTEAVRRLITYGDLVYPLVQAQHGGGSSCVA